jgi:hypothetical protein
MIRIRHASRRLLPAAADLRQVEVDEFAALDTDSERCMRLGLLAGGARTVFINDEPAAMFGIVDYGDHNVVWAVFTRAIERHPIAFLRESRGSRTPSIARSSTTSTRAT